MSLFFVFRKLNMGNPTKSIETAAKFCKDPTVSQAVRLYNNNTYMTYCDEN